MPHYYWSQFTDFWFRLCVEKDHVVPPGNLCSNLLHNFLRLVGSREPPHRLEVSGGEPGRIGRSVSKVRGEAVNDLCTPAEFLLASQDLVPDLPI